MEHDDLEALFESTRAEAERAATEALDPPTIAMPEPATDGGPETAESPAGATSGQHDLPARGSIASMLDVIAIHAAVPGCPNAGSDGSCTDCRCGAARELRDRVGHLTRELHESLQELRLDSSLADMAMEIPDARNRLKYVTEMCERSAQKVLDTLDELSPLQDAAREDSAALLARWDRLLQERRRPDEGFMALFASTRDHLAASMQRAERTASLHSDIMMAQDFQDLTGQVCRKIEGITERIESKLLKLLVDTAPPDQRMRQQERLEGPQVVTGRNDAVASQGEVDDLLSSLGF
jgi:chemotaxis protein CheZ